MKHWEEMIERLETPETERRLAELYGQNEETVRYQKERYASLLRSYGKIFGDREEIFLISAPGRTEIGGEEAKGFEQLAIAFDTGDEPKEIYHGTRKAEINIDTISQNFEAGDVVTLNTLKEKKLVSVQAGEIKVLARGKLDKALTVVAQSFSAAAVKMIVLTGGTVIVDEPSPERRKK